MRSFGLVVVVVEAGSPVLRWVSGQERPEAPSLHVRRDLHACDVQERGGEVQVRDDRGGRRTRSSDARPAHDERRAERLLVHPALVVPPVLAEVEALVGRVHDHGVVGETGFIQPVEDPSQIVVDRCDGPEVVLDVSLVLPPREVVAPETGRAKGLVPRSVGRVPLRLLLLGHALECCRLPLGKVRSRLRLQLQVVDVEHVPGDRHLLVRGRRSTPRVVVEQRLRLRDRLAVVLRQVIRAGHPAPMRRLVLEHEHEGLVGVAALGQPLERQVGHDVRDVTFAPARRGRVGIRVQKIRVVVRSLSGQHLPVVETGGRALEMPFPDHGGLVAGLAEQLGERDLRSVEHVRVVSHSIQMAVKPGLNHRARRGADRVGDHGPVEPHSPVREAVDVRGLVDDRAVGADGLEGVVVGEHEHDVGPIPFSRCPGLRSWLGT